MTPDPFIEWVDKEIESWTRYSKLEVKAGFSFTAIANAKIRTFRAVKEKYLSILPPPQSTN